MRPLWCSMLGPDPIYTMARSLSWIGRHACQGAGRELRSLTGISEQRDFTQHQRRGRGSQPQISPKTNSSFTRKREA